MKKIILPILLLIGVAAFSQSTIYGYSVQVAHWYGNEWVYQRPTSESIRFDLSGKAIIAHDYAHSVYYTYKMVDSDGSVTTWDAYDEKGRNCFVIMSYGRDGINCLKIGYIDVMYCYYFN